MLENNLKLSKNVYCLELWKSLNNKKYIILINEDILRYLNFGDISDDGANGTDVNISDILSISLYTHYV